MLQLRDCALNVAKKKNKLAVAEMFSTEIKFAGDCLIKWFNKKFKSKNLELSNDVKRKYEIENPIDWIRGRCCICKFPHKINPTNFNATAEEMSYADFVIFKEHKFLRNIFSERELSSTDSLKNMEQHHKCFEKFLKISVYLQNSINTINEFSECYKDELIDFCNEFCADCSNFAEIKERVLDVLIKNKQGSKIPTFTLQVYAFVYQKLMDFPQTRFDYETLTTNELFDSVYKIINVKTHLHHFHATGKIIGYAHDFCNAKVRENKDVLTCIAHIFFWL